GIRPPHERRVDAGVDEALGEHLPVGVARDRAEEADRNIEAAEGDCGVERSASGNHAERPVIVDEVDEGLAAGDDHRASGCLGGISPEPRAIRVTGMTWWTAEPVFPSSRRKSCSAAVRPIACGSCATTEIAGSSISASGMSS